MKELFDPSLILLDDTIVPPKTGGAGIGNGGSGQDPDPDDPIFGDD